MSLFPPATTAAAPRLPAARLAAGAAGALALAAWGCAVHTPEPATSFALEGAHRDLACSSCHADGFEEPPPRRCDECHAGDRPRPHWDDDCGECHGQERWDDLEFDHEDWTLDGAHLEIDCSACHQGDTWEDGVAGEDCRDCHGGEQPHGDTPPGHTTMDCHFCHDTTSWEEPTWDHGFFPLEGGHDGVGCTDCHATTWEGTSTACEDCHYDDRPSGSHWESGCGNCHTIYGW